MIKAMRKWFDESLTNGKLPVLLTKSNINNAKRSKISDFIVRLPNSIGDGYRSVKGKSTPIEEIKAIRVHLIADQSGGFSIFNIYPYAK